MATSKIPRPWQSLFPDFPAQPGAGFHNCMYRGKNLGTDVTPAQWTAISNGTFDNLFVGDYWNKNGVSWLIAAFDYWYGYGDTACTTHHAVIVPYQNLVNSADISNGPVLNADTTLTGGYLGTDFGNHTTPSQARTKCREKIDGMFGSGHVLSHRELLSNAANGYETSVAWVDSDLELLSERMVFGSAVFGNIVNGSNVPALFTLSHTQLPLFMFNKNQIRNGQAFWLRDLVNASWFTAISKSGRSDYYPANSTSPGARPVFGIKA